MVRSWRGVPPLFPAHVTLKSYGRDEIWRNLPGFGRPDKSRCACGRFILRVGSHCGSVSNGRGDRPVARRRGEGDSGADPEVAETLTSLRTKHESAVSVLIEDAGKASDLLSDLEPLWEEMQKVLTGVLLLRELSTRSRDLVGSFGERLIVPIFTAYLNQIDVRAEAVDARSLIVTKDEADFALVDFDETKLRCREVVEIVGRGVVPIVTGFICATTEGITTTLGRGGSDYSASVVGYSVNADEIQIWTDVDGVMTADPRIVSSARVLRQISYKEAAGNVLFRSQGAASEDDHARGGSGHPDPHQEHIRSGTGRDTDHDRISQNSSGSENRVVNHGSDPGLD